LDDEAGYEMLLVCTFDSKPDVDDDFTTIHVGHFISEGPRQDESFYITLTVGTPGCRNKFC